MRRNTALSVSVLKQETGGNNVDSRKQTEFLASFTRLSNWMFGQKLKDVQFNPGSAVGYDLR